MLTRITRSATVVALSLVATFATLQPAHADTATFRDKGAHLTTVTVTHGATNVTVKANVQRMTFGSYFTFWLDTNANNSGPEYKMVIHPNSDGMSVLRVGNFTDSGWSVRCNGFRASADVFGPQFVSIIVPRSCIGYPRKVRVSVRGYYDVPGPNVIDWAPGKRQFFCWVNR